MPKGIKYTQSQEEVMKTDNLNADFNGPHDSAGGEGRPKTLPKQSIESATSKVSTDYSSAPSK